MEERILVLAQRGRDAAVINQLLARQGHEYCVCHSGDDLAQRLAEGAGTALVTEESLAETDRSALARWLGAQPTWSDFPFILLATKRAGRRTKEAAQVLGQLGNVVVLERPIHGETLASAAASALRGRRRQYEARRRLEDLGAVEERLRQLNATLETRISQRTQELSRANNQLMQEVAERERAQAALVQSQKMDAVGQLTGGIAHDFNNLLTVIAGNLELIQRHSDDPHRAERLVESALRASDRASKLTRQLLAFSRTQRLTLKPVDVNALIMNMGELLARAIGPEHPILMNLAAAGAWAMADANQLELAILNLVINARDAMSEGGVVRIESACLSACDPSLAPGDYAVIRVRDSGPGIPPHLMEKVFEPFFTTKPLGKGTGLGLAQVYGIAHQSGGVARIESHQGEGAVVEIWLPAAPSHGPEAEAPPLAALPKGQRERVLVVEDDAAVRRFIVDCLEMLGFTVTEASDGREGLERLNREPPALMIVDYAMPDMNGAEVAAEALARSPQLPIILATGHADMDAVHRVVEPKNVLKKPFHISDLERAVRAALDPAGRRAGAGP